jgi:hypothetical protein
VPTCPPETTFWETSTSKPFATFSKSKRVSRFQAPRTTILTTTKMKTTETTTTTTTKTTTTIKITTTKKTTTRRPRKRKPAARPSTGQASTLFLAQNTMSTTAELGRYVDLYQ